MTLYYTELETRSGRSLVNDGHMCISAESDEEALTKLNDYVNKLNKKNNNTDVYWMILYTENEDGSMRTVSETL